MTDYETVLSALTDVTDVWDLHDPGALAALTDDECVEQYRARDAVFRFVEQHWDNAQKAGEPVHSAEWQIIAGLVTLLGGLRSVALGMCQDRMPDRFELEA